MTTTPPDAPPARDRIVAAAARAADPAGLAELRRLLDAHPQVWQEAATLAQAAERAWVCLVAQGDALHSEILVRQLAEQRRRLGSDTASPAERLLIGEVVQADLMSQYAAAALAAAQAGGDAQRSDFLQRQADRAARRLAAAVKNLVLVRKLLRPTVSALDLARGPAAEAPGPGTARGRLTALAVN